METMSIEVIDITRATKSDMTNTVNALFCRKMGMKEFLWNQIIPLVKDSGQENSICVQQLDGLMSPLEPFCQLCWSIHQIKLKKKTQTYKSYNVTKNTHYIQTKRHSWCVLLEFTCLFQKLSSLLLPIVTNYRWLSR